MTEKLTRRVTGENGERFSFPVVFHPLFPLKSAAALFISGEEKLVLAMEVLQAARMW